MNLPNVQPAALSDVELASVLDRAALVLEIEARKAITGHVIAAASRMVMTADVLRRSAELLLVPMPDRGAGDRRLFADARECLRALAGLVWWEAARLETYHWALGRAADQWHDRTSASLKPDTEA